MRGRYLVKTYTDMSNDPKAPKLCNNESTPWQDTEHKLVCTLKKGHAGPHEAQHEGRMYQWVWSRHRNCHIVPKRP
jgi:hypothetical protein